MPAILVVWALVQGGPRRGIRVGFAVWGLGQVALAGLVAREWMRAEADPFVEGVPPLPIVDLLALASAAIVCAAVAAGAVRSPAKPRVMASAVLAALGVLAIHQRSVTRSVADQFQQDLPRFELRLVGARRIGPVEELPSGIELVRCGEHQCVLEPDDSLTLSSHEHVQRIRLEHDAGAPRLSVLLRGNAIEQIRDRSARRIEAFDAWVLDGTVELVARHGDVLLDAEVVLDGGGDDAAIERLFERMSRTP